MNISAAYSPWIELAAVLILGPVLIVTAAVLADRFVRNAVWRRTLWQSAVAAVGLLVVMEITGLGHGIGSLVTSGLVEDTVHQPRAVANDETETRVATIRESRQTASLDEMRLGEGEAPAEPLRRFEKTAQQELRPPGPFRDYYLGDRATSGGPVFTLPEPIALSDSAPIEPESSEAPAFASETDSDEDKKSVAAASSVPRAENRSVVAGVALWPAAVWSVGCLFVLSLILVSQLSLVRFRRRIRVLDDAVLRRRIEGLAHRIGFRSTIRLMESSQVTTPVAFGMFTPTLVLPPRFADNFGIGEQQAMLAHELAHLAARDSAWHLFARLVCAVLWWQPAVWLLQRRIRIASEAAADEASLVVPDGPRHLAECLVEMGRRLTSPRRVAWLQVTGEGISSDLGKRVVRLLGLERSKWQTPRRLRTGLAKSVVVLLLLISVVCCTAWARPQAASREGETTMTLLKSGWCRSLASVALLTLWGSVSGDASADQTQPDPTLTDADMTVALLAEDEEEEEARRHRERDEEAEEREIRRERERDEEEEERETRRDRERDEQEREARHREREEHREREAREREREGEHREREREHGEREHDEREMDREKVLHNLMREREEIIERHEHLERELGELPDDADEEGAEIQAQLRELGAALKRIDAHAREIKGGEHRERERHEKEMHREEALHHLMREREEVIERHEHLERELAELPDDADEEAAKIQVELRELAQLVKRIDARAREIKGGEKAEREGPRPEHGPRGEMERRLHHLRVAIDNLREAGMNDAAEHLMREGERLERELGEGHRHPHEEHAHEHGPHERHPEHPRPEHRPEGPPHPEQIERVIGEMHQQMDQMRRQMAEMQQAIKMLIERER